MPSVTLTCKTCGRTARRQLMNEPGSRGIHETSSEPASCPSGHGLMVRVDGVPQENWALWAKGCDPIAMREILPCRVGVGGFDSHLLH
jgi:hypothetical protein